MDPGTVQTALGWRQFFGDGPAAPAAVILLLANVAQWIAGQRERAKAARALEEANRRCIDISASVTTVAQQFVQAAHNMGRGNRRPSPHLAEDSKAEAK
jgi:hypothetical protein